MVGDIGHVAVVGTGVIGASWASLFLAKGLDVTATDISPGAEARLRAFVDAAWPTLTELGLAPGASTSRLRFVGNLKEAVSDVQIVQESGPERLDLKKQLYAELDGILPPEVIIASSTSGLTMSEIQSACESHPERCVIGHPFNPPHLIPLVEIVGGKATSQTTIERLDEFYTALGKRTIRVHKEVAGHVGNRLQAALWREVLYLISEGVVSVSDADTAVCWGPGLRWGIMGPMLLFHLGGGAGGVEHYFDQFTEPMTDWFNALGHTEITPELRQKVTAGVYEEAGTLSVADLAKRRDEVLLALLKLRSKGEPNA
ncbi:TPA: 3-hydroxyacyl-CoA dehydrogenase [Burkholderia cenocepacia]|nr:3-hydroxyacyl-CoA dehydrogenase [Burkholderia cenocepacia]